MGLLASLGVKLLLTISLVGAYTMFALGIVFIYRASNVLNLAHGAMAMIPAYVAYALATRIGVFPAVIIALVAGGAIGVAVERLVVRRLAASSATAQTVGTVAVLGLLVAVAARIWGTTPLRGPSVFPERTFRMGDSVIGSGDIGLFITALVVAVGFMLFFRYSDFGLALRAAADNKQAASLMGIDPDVTTMIGWLLAGVLAALGGVLLGASTNLHPYTLALQVLPAFVAALIGGLQSIPGALLGSVVVGLAVGIVPTLGTFGRQVGAAELGLALVAFAVMILRGEKFSGAQSRSGL